MDDNKFRQILDRIEQLPPTLGHRITLDQYNILYDKIRHLEYKYGKEKCDEYIAHWQMKIEGYPVEYISEMFSNNVEIINGGNPCINVGLSLKKTEFNNLDECIKLMYEKAPDLGIPNKLLDDYFKDVDPIGTHDAISFQIDLKIENHIVAHHKEPNVIILNTDIYKSFENEIKNTLSNSDYLADNAIKKYRGIKLIKSEDIEHVEVY